MPGSADRPLSALLFDFDGTLIDSAPDLIGALNAMRAERGMPPLARGDCTADQIANGSRSLMGAHLLRPDEDVEKWRPRFMEEYSKRGHVDTTFFPGASELLDELDARGVPWAIVTNKPTHQTMELLPVLGIEGRPAMVVCADTYPRPKPDPQGILEVCASIGVEPAAAGYVGDALVDLHASDNAGSRFIAAGWGYWEGDPDLALDSPGELLGLLA